MTACLILIFYIERSTAGPAEMQQMTGGLYFASKALIVLASGLNVASVAGRPCHAASEKGETERNVTVAKCSLTLGTAVGVVRVFRANMTCD